MYEPRCCVADGLTEPPIHKYDWPSPSTTASPSPSALSATAADPLEASADVAVPCASLLFTSMPARSIVTVIDAPLPDVVEIVAVEGTVTVMLSTASPLKYNAAADAALAATVTVSPFVTVPNASAADALDVIVVVTVAVLVTSWLVWAMELFVANRAPTARAEIKDSFIMMLTG